mmetsp:Transcript_4781/g.8200  ORF Transcript_4781/g.8200 Transcript_4781/m.8200 type:complete len:105 (+) Transcript_4781:348-662(+)
MIWIPPICVCIFRRVGHNNWVTALLSFFLGGLSVALDSKAHALQFGFFFAPKVLEFLTQASIKRGIIKADERLWKAAKMFSLGVIMMALKVKEEEEESDGEKAG